MLSWAVFTQQDGRRARVPVDLGAGHLPLWEITCALTGETRQVLFELPCWFEAPPLLLHQPLQARQLTALPSNIVPGDFGGPKTKAGTQGPSALLRVA
eukprot:2826659-Prymnesium_polylepis.1